MKKCAKCNQEFPATLEFFRKEKRTASGLSADCKICRNIARRAAYTPEKGRAWHQRAYRDPAKRLAAKERAERWAENNRDRYNENMRRHGAKWRAANKEYLREKRKRDYADYMSDGRKRAYVAMSAGIRQSIVKGKDGHQWEKIVGYTRQDLIRHLERQFAKGMGWENFGSGWHIDHIVPVSAFRFDDLNDPTLKVCWSLANLRPLWKAENLAKTNKRIFLL